MTLVLLLLFCNVLACLLEDAWFGAVAAAMDSWTYEDGLADGEGYHWRSDLNFLLLSYTAATLLWAL
jgi:hypothetical protein